MTDGESACPFLVGLASGSETIWCASREGYVIAINPELKSLVSQFTFGDVMDHTSALAVGDELIWVGVAGHVRALDIDTGVPKWVASAEDPAALWFDGQLLWVADRRWPSTIRGLDPSTGQSIVSLPLERGASPVALTQDGTRLWVANYDTHTVQAVDVSTHTLGDAIRVGDHPTGVASDGAQLWIANEAGSLQRLPLPNDH
jgi:YVTN family beta-propeller protein